MSTNKHIHACNLFLSFALFHPRKHTATPRAATTIGSLPLSHLLQFETPTYFHFYPAIVQDSSTTWREERGWPCHNCTEICMLMHRLWTVRRAAQHTSSTRCHQSELHTFAAFRTTAALVVVFWSERRERGRERDRGRHSALPEREKERERKRAPERGREKESERKTLRERDLCLLYLPPHEHVLRKKRKQYVSCFFSVYESLVMIMIDIIKRSKKFEIRQTLQLKCFPDA